MKGTTARWIGIAIMAGAITFSLIQMRIPVVRADGCPDNPWPECSCVLTNSVTTEGGSTTCYFSCVCGGGGGGDFFLIEREYVN
jgi:hypothetical protein